MDKNLYLNVKIPIDTSRFFLELKKFNKENFLKIFCSSFYRDLVEIKSLVQQYNIGLVISEVSPTHIASAIKTLQNDTSLLSSLRSNCHKAAEIEHWGNEKPKLEAIMRTIYPE